MKNDTRSIAAAAIIGALYAVLTMVLAPISYGAIQFRVSEALCILPYFLPSTAWGLFIGCAVANMLTGNVLDIVFGSLATLLAGLCTAHFGKKSHGPLPRIAACMMPVLFNALVVGAVITKAYNGLGVFSSLPVFALNAAQVGLGEAAVMFFIGLPLMHYLPKKQFFREFVSKTGHASKGDAL